MVSMNFFIITALGVILAFLIIKLVKNSSTNPDPWENEISKDEVDKLQREICLKCGAETKTEQYYCPKCNNATGKYVPYLPFVNIQFNYSMHQSLWSKLKSKDVNYLNKAIIVLFIIFTEPFMIIAFFFYLVIKGFFKFFCAVIKGIKGFCRWIDIKDNFGMW